MPLAACFAYFVDAPVVALSLLAAAAATDVLDGWIARRYDLVTATGTVLDPVTDKLFVLVVAVSLIASGHLSLPASLLLGTRELGELPLVAWFAFSHDARAARAEQPAANRLGKLVTVLQFVSVAWALFRRPELQIWLYVTAGAGAVAASSYWRRALSKT